MRILYTVSDIMTKEQERISWRNWRKAIKHFESTGELPKDRKPYTYCMHHKDDSLKTNNIERYIQWNIEDLEIVTYGEHTKIHNATRDYKKGEEHSLYGIKFSDEHRKHLSENHADFKGENHPLWGKHLYACKEDNPNYGSHRNDDTKAKMSESQKGRHYYNNGINEVKIYQCPEGYVPGRIKKQ